MTQLVKVEDRFALGSAPLLALDEQPHQLVPLLLERMED